MYCFLFAFSRKIQYSIHYLHISQNNIANLRFLIDYLAIWKGFWRRFSSELEALGAIETFRSAIREALEEEIERSRFDDGDDDDDNYDDGDANENADALAVIADELTETIKNRYCRDLFCETVN